MIVIKLSIWSFSSNGKYSVQSLYAVINHRGVVPVYVSAVWKDSTEGSNFSMAFMQK